MTSFAHGKFHFGNFSVFISFKSFNNRYLEICFKSPSIPFASEKAIREMIKNHVFRGKVEVVADIFHGDASQCDIQINEPLLNQLLEKILGSVKKFRKRVNLSLDFLLKSPHIFHFDCSDGKFTEEDLEKIRSAAEQVFRNFLLNREQEGEYILKDLRSSLELIEESLKKIFPLQAKIEEELYEQYRKKLEKFIADHHYDEKRIMMEAAILAEKSCITEEINRLATHAQRLKSLLTAIDISNKGREADFLTQEMQRETHTMAAKTNSLDVHQVILLIRREIEKIRQQVQNIE